MNGSRVDYAVLGRGIISREPSLLHRFLTTIKTQSRYNHATPMSSLFDGFFCKEKRKTECWGKGRSLTIAPLIESRTRRQRKKKGIFRCSSLFLYCYFIFLYGLAWQQICEYDRFSRPCVVGDLHFSLADRENVFGSSSTGPGVDIWADVMRNTLPDESRPQLLISLSYLPSAERLTVVVLKAKNLVVPASKENIGNLNIFTAFFFFFCFK